MIFDGPASSYLAQRVGRLLLLVLLLVPPASADAQSWAGFYDPGTLNRLQTRARPGIEENFRDVVWPALTQEERGTLGRVSLNFPIEDAKHPMNFYAMTDGGRRIIALPVSSLRFLADISLAYAWLDASNYSIDPITDYLAMLKYQWVNGTLAGRQYKPAEALGIPPNAISNPRVQRECDRLFGSAVIFVIGHELGHLYHRHAMIVSPEQSRHQEEEADRFGMELMRRIGEPPVGMLPFFAILAHLDPYTTDPEYQTRRAIATHPVSTSRLRAIAAGVETYSADFARTGTEPATLARIAQYIRLYAAEFDDPGVQGLIRQKGLTANPALLGPRTKGATMPTATGRPDGMFSGSFRGKWRDAKGTDLDVDMQLTQRGDTVQGSYNFGAGNVTIVGTLTNDMLYYNWKWGTDYHGKGILKPTGSGQSLGGTWGYTEAESGAGTWELRRAE